MSYAAGIRDGLVHGYCAPAVKSMSESWRPFLYAGYDPAASITLDKLPGAFMVEALSARVFGFSTWSILLPQVIETVIAILLPYGVVRRWLGPAAGLFAAAISNDAHRGGPSACEDFRHTAHAAPDPRGRRLPPSGCRRATGLAAGSRCLDGDSRSKPRWCRRGASSQHSRLCISVPRPAGCDGASVMLRSPAWSLSLCPCPGSSWSC